MTKKCVLQKIAFASLIGAIITWVLSAMTSATIHFSRGNDDLVYIALRDGQFTYSHTFSGNSMNSWNADSSWIWDPGYHSDATLFAPFEISILKLPESIKLSIPSWTFFLAVVVFCISTSYMNNRRKVEAEQDAPSNR